MIAALVRKELREMLPFVVLALLVQFLLVGFTLHSRSGLQVDAGYAIPFVSGELLWYTFFVAGLLAAVLGLWQTMWEGWHGTFLFLLHRPIPRERIACAKLLTGAAVCLVAALVPVAWYAVWAATPGTHASPFAWSMTAWAWQWAVELPLVYLGAFLSGLRPARWFGSRFAPLAGGIVLFLMMALFSAQLSAWWPEIMLGALAVDACYILAILYVAATRDYS